MTFDSAGKGSLHASRLAIIKSLIREYDGTLPLHHYLKNAFRHRRNFGSKDRGIYSEWCYTYFRIGKALAGVELETRLAVAWFLVHGADDPVFRFLSESAMIRFPATDEYQTPDQRLAFIRNRFPDFNLADLFPFSSPLSDGFTIDAMAASMLRQPLVWMRTVTGKKQQVIQALNDAMIRFEGDEELPEALAVEQRTRLTALPVFQERYFEIQDRSSQVAGSMIPAGKGEHWWDCCCGAGGKSIQLLDRVPDIRITASDNRESILENYRNRTQAFQRQVSVHSVNLEQPVQESFQPDRFDGIVADVPCSGSGTWARNPENLSFFYESDVSDYVNRQRVIVNRVVPFLKRGGTLTYITCSVFREENENQAGWILSTQPVNLLDMRVIPGIPFRADSLFVASFVKV